MGTQSITRTPVTFYTVKKKKINKTIKGDVLKLTFTSLPRARAYAMEMHNSGNFKSLTNSNGVLLTI